MRSRLPLSHRALTLAAGQGRRLRSVSRNRPKVLTVINGHSILAWQRCALKTAGISQQAIVTGFNVEALAGLVEVQFHNPEFATSNMLWSLVAAREWLDRDTIVSYSDIIYTHEVVETLVSDAGDISIATDPLWRARYEGRTEHPLKEAELVEFSPDGRVLSVGKRDRLPHENRMEEFIGLMRLSRDGCRTFLEYFDEALMNVKHLQGPHDSWLKTAYLADFLTYLIEHGVEVQAVSTTAPWIEIDTPQDLVFARNKWNRSFHPDC